MSKPSFYYIISCILFAINLPKCNSIFSSNNVIIKFWLLGIEQNIDKTSGWIDALVSSQHYFLWVLFTTKWMFSLCWRFTQTSQLSLLDNPMVCLSFFLISVLCLWTNFQYIQLHCHLYQLYLLIISIALHPANSHVLGCSNPCFMSWLITI